MEPKNKQIHKIRLVVILASATVILLALEGLWTGWPGFQQGALLTAAFALGLTTFMVAWTVRRNG